MVTSCIEDIPDVPMEGTCNSPPHSPVDTLGQRLLLLYFSFFVIDRNFVQV